MKKRPSKKNERKPDQNQVKKAILEIGSNARVQKDLKAAGLIATLPTEKEDTNPVEEVIEKKERSILPVVPHLRLVKKKEEENLGERKENPKKKTLSEDWFERKQKRSNLGKHYQKDSGFMLITKLGLLITFIAMALIDIFLL